MNKGAIALSLALILAACQPSGTGVKANLKNDDDKTLYTIGYMFGERLKTLGLTPAEVNNVAAGVVEAATGKKSQVDVVKYRPKIRDMFQGRMKKVAETTKKEGAAYLDNFVKGGGKKTASGLAYKVTKEGKGANPKATDKVKVHYHGTLIDGTVFDSSKDRGEPVTFPLNRVIKGWTEGLQLIKEGGAVELVIPAALAYGEAGAPPKIPGGATLIFQVELLEIVKDDAKKDTKKKK